MLTFSEYAKTLYGYCADGSKTSDFVLTLISHIMEEPSSDEDIKKDAADKYNPLAGLSLSALEKTYNGFRKISNKNASAILRRADKERFSDYIEETLSVDILPLLGEKLRNFGYEVNDSNVPIRCADIFVELLEKLTEPVLSVIEFKDESKQYLIEASFELVPIMPDNRQVMSKSEFYLLMEAGSQCPSCGKKLISENNSNSLSKYTIVPILPPEPSDAMKEELGDLLDSKADRDTHNNKIPLCFDCANKYLTHTTKAECVRLLDVKGKLQRNYDALETLEKMYIEEQIELVLRNISTATKEQLSDPLSYKALRISEKIPGNNVPLIMKTEGFVVPYYKYIKSVFSQLEREGVLSFDEVASDVKRSYIKLRTSGLSQDEIYAQLVNWVKTKTNAENALACEIIVAFFVQNCEVFDEIAK